MFDDLGPNWIVPEKAYLSIKNDNILMIQMWVPENNSPVGFGTGLRVR